MKVKVKVARKPGVVGGRDKLRRKLGACWFSGLQIWPGAWPRGRTQSRTDYLIGPQLMQG